jgi:hypothetical protein
MVLELLGNVDASSLRTSVLDGSQFYDVEFHMIDKARYDEMKALAEETL